MSDERSSLLNFSLGKQLPVIRQTELAECGLASLAMVACFHGFKTDLTQMRRRFPISSRGVTLRTLAESANQIGFSTRALKCSLGSLRKLRLPAILHWDLNHFVVLKSVSGRSAEIHDPARGYQRLTIEELGDHFSGVVLELEPTAQLQKTDERERLRFSSLWSQMNGLTGTIIQILFFSIAIQIFLLAAPQYFQVVIDQVLPTFDANLLFLLALGFTFLLIMRQIASALRSLLTLFAGTTLAYQISINLFHRLIRLPLGYFNARHMGDVLSRFDSIDPIQDFLIQGFIKSIIDGFMALVTLGIMFIYSPLLGSITVVATLIYLILRLALVRRMRLLTEELIIAGAEENSNFIETLRGILPIKSFADESSRQLRWQNLLAETFNSTVRLERLNIFFGISRESIFELERIILVFVAARLIMENQFSVGMIFAFMAYRDQFVEAASSLIEVLINFRMLRLHLDRIADIALSEPEPSGGTRLDIKEASIKATNLTFSYDGAREPVLKDVNLEIAGGSSIALIGPSGRGKTTLLKLLTGLLTPQSGTVSVDGTILTSVDPKHFRGQIATVMQADHLFSGSIMDNITLFDLEPDADWMKECAKTAQIHDDINEMPMGYDTPVGDMGAALSGGQIQRVILARALYRKPKILFIDEGTSNLDIPTERAVNTAIASLGITRIIVAHRPETIRSADRLFMVMNGGLREVNHDALDETPVKSE